MYSTKLTVSHSICSELTPPPPKKRTQLSVVFLSVFFFLLFFFSVLHSKSFTSDKVVKSTQCASPCTYYVQSKCVHPTSLSSKLNTRFQYFKKNQTKTRNGDFEKFYSCVFFFLLSFFPVRVSGVVTTSRKNKNPTLHSVPSGFIKRCNVGKILYLVNFKACQDYEPHRHYTIILGHKGLLHSLARGWNHSVTSCKQKMKKEKKKKYFLVNLLTRILCH